MIAAAAATLLSHYRRHPGQLVMLLLGLWVASALWSGVQAINASARDSYDRSAALFDAGLDRIERRDGEPLTLDTYLALRRAGIAVSPLIEGELVLAGEARVTLLGIEPLTLPAASGIQASGGPDALGDFLQPPWRTRLAADTLADLDAARDGEQLLDRERQALPPLALDPSVPPGTLITDIGVAGALLGMPDDAISHLLIAPGAPATLPDALVRLRAEQLAEPGQLSDSFHLNLTALGLLALVVGLFIVHAALSLTLEQRLGMLRTLRALGVPGMSLVALLAVELVVLGLIGALLGIVSGVWLAGQLLPDVAASLATLYGERVGAELALPWHYWLGGIAITLGGLFSAGATTLWRAARLDVLGLGQRQRWRGGLQRQLTIMALLGAALWLLALGLWLWLSGQPPGERLLAGFALVALGLLAATLLLPPLLGLLLGWAVRGLRHRPLAQWAMADLQLQLPRLQLAMMALLLALATNLGVGSMVGGFRLTFLDWLDQRLVADAYVRPPAEQFDASLAWLEARDEVVALLPTRRADATLRAAGVDAQPVGVYGITPASQLTRHWPLLTTQAGVEQAWQAFEQGAALINEQLAIATGLGPGDRLTLSSAEGPHETAIAAVYPDYGNPRGEVTLTTAALAAQFAAPPGSLGILLAEGSDVAALGQALDRAIDLAGASLIDQQAVKQQARTIFERTFTITRALTLLTLAVAGLALFSSLLAQGGERRAQLAPLWALGVTRGRLAGVSLAQLSLAALVTALLAIPLGIALTWGLVAVINVAAFGWRLPLHVFPSQLLLALVLALAVAWLAALIPLWRLWRSRPRQLLMEFSAA
ncbi:ABC transporter permease [Halomonas sp. 1513]|nr:ABC transporter permease [Halomonas sp. 1513]APX94695.1 ABC transporter permease [Halomonas sp. 1513]